MNLKKYLGTCIFLFVWILINNISADALTNVSTCRTLNESGTYYQMNVSISGATTSFCINITSSNITFDCAGKLIDANDAADYGLWAESVYNITVMNCTFQDWDTQAINLLNINDSLFTNISFSSLPDAPPMLITGGYRNNFSYIRVADADIGATPSQTVIYDTLTHYNYYSNINIDSISFTGSSGSIMTIIPSCKIFTS